MRRLKKGPLLWWGFGFLSALGAVFLLTAWMAGVVYSELPPPAEIGPDFKKVDVIVCLTGGRGRIRKALDLFEQGFGKTLYISGIDRNVTMKNILRELRFIGPVDERRIILEKLSTNTIQNARQVAEYVKEKGDKSVLLVTSIYHARRAHFVFRKVLPSDVRLEVSWFERDPFDRDYWWKTWTGIWVTIVEFIKFFVTYLRLSF